MYGDRFQIQSIDMSKHSGKRYRDSLLKKCPNVKEESSTRRYGKPLINALQVLVPNIYTLASHTSPYEMIQIVG